MKTGLGHIQDLFIQLRAEGRAAVMPYFTVGYPTIPLSLEIFQAIAESGADLIELGVPFSDPLADGPTIQRSTQVALEGGVSVLKCLEVVRQLRDQGCCQPLILMGYYNPILAFGIAHFVSEAAAAGVDGFIVPDLPPEEAGELEAACLRSGSALIYLLAPNSTPERIHVVTRRAKGFIYLVSLTGVTGARKALPDDLEVFINRVKTQTDVPLAVGFGVSTPQQARQVGCLANGVIVGSALINAIDGADDIGGSAGRFVASLRDALNE